MEDWSAGSIGNGDGDGDGDGDEGASVPVAARCSGAAGRGQALDARQAKDARCSISGQYG